MNTPQPAHVLKVNKLRIYGRRVTALAPHANFSLRTNQVDHPAFEAAIREIATLHARGLEAGAAEGLLLFAQTGSGKTTALQSYRQAFPTVRRSGCVRIPVVYVRTPASPTVASLGKAVLTALGDPFAHRGNAGDKLDRIINFFKECEVELLLVDEFQHFNDASRSSRQHTPVSDWLKLLIEGTKSPVVLAGLPRSQRVIHQNPQLRRRFSAGYYMEPFSLENEEDSETFRAVLKTMNGWVPLKTIAFHDPDVATRFYYASHGLIDYMIKVIDKAVSLAPTEKHCIDLPDLAEAFRRAVWRDAPDRLNPFCEKAEYRLLNLPGEPFDVWDDPTQYMADSIKPRC